MIVPRRVYSGSASGAYTSSGPLRIYFGKRRAQSSVIAGYVGPTVNRPEFF